MNTSWNLAIGGRICVMWFTRMLSSRDNLLFFWIVLLASVAGDSLNSNITSADFEAECSSPCKAHLFSTYLKKLKQVGNSRKMEM